MGRAGRERAVEYFTWERTIRGLESLWRSHLRRGVQKSTPSGTSNRDRGTRVVPIAGDSVRWLSHALARRQDDAKTGEGALLRVSTFVSSPLTGYVQRRPVGGPFGSAGAIPHRRDDRDDVFGSGWCRREPWSRPRHDARDGGLALEVWAAGLGVTGIRRSPFRIVSIVKFATRILWHFPRLIALLSTINYPETV